MAGWHRIRPTKPRASQARHPVSPQAGRAGPSCQHPGVAIAPVTVRLLVYGQKANVANIRTRAAALLKEENGSVDAAAFVETPADDVHAEIDRDRIDREIALKKPTPSQAGMVITLHELHERVANEWLAELPAAKTCVVFASWTSLRDAARWQMLISEGHRSLENRPLGG